MEVDKDSVVKYVLYRKLSPVRTESERDSLLTSFAAIIDRTAKDDGSVPVCVDSASVVYSDDMVECKIGIRFSPGFFSGDAKKWISDMEDNWFEVIDNAPVS